MNNVLGVPITISVLREDVQLLYIDNLPRDRENENLHQL